MLVGAILKKNPAPCRRQPLRASKVCQIPLQGHFAFGIGADGIFGIARRRARALVAHLDSRPIIFSAASRHDGARTAGSAKGAQQVLTRGQPAIIFGTAGIESRRCDPREVQQMRRPYRLDQTVDRLKVKQVGAVHSRAGRRRRLVREDGMHLVAGRAQRFQAAAADESARAGHQHSSFRDQAIVVAPSSGYAASRADMTTGSIGHSMARAGSFQRTPRSKPDTYGTDIMYKTSVASRSVMKPCENPFGMNSERRFSEVNSAPNHCRRVGEPARRSTMTSKIPPAVQRTSLSSVWGAD